MGSGSFPPLGYQSHQSRQAKEAVTCDPMSWVECKQLDTSGCEARECLVDGFSWLPVESSAGLDAASSASDASQTVSWLVRLGAHSHSCGDSRRLSRSERAKHAILSWRLKRPYLLYCLACSFVTAVLLTWNVVKGVQNQWNLPQWKHHRWEEVLEVGIGVFMVIETLLTLRVLGIRNFCHNRWCLFDLFVSALTVASIAYGLEHLGRKGEICEADVPLLMARFVLQPVRVLAAFASAYRTRQMQSGVDELQVNFNVLQASSDAAQFAVLQDRC